MSMGIALSVKADLGVSPVSYPVRILYLLITMVLIAFGIMIYLKMDIMSLPGGRRVSGIEPENW